MLIVVGTNHKFSPIGFRERIAFSKKSVKAALPLILKDASLEGAVIISTCNRVEIYASCPVSMPGLDMPGMETVLDFLSLYHEIDRDRLTPYLYSYVNKDAARHLFRVAAGLDSQVMGEAQILGQVERFFEEARSDGYTDAFLEQIFDTAVATARQVRAGAAIWGNNLSIGDAAISLVKREIRQLRNKKAVVIGLGKISEMVAKRLSEEDISSVFVSNRTHEKAKEIAKSIGAQAIRFDELKSVLKDADIIISATSSPHVTVRKEDLIGINKEVLIIDLALPRDVEPAAADIPGVKLLNLDDIGSIKAEGMDAEAEKARLIIDREVDNLWQELTGSAREKALLR
jgi:glutamyl-tRNA reductase